MSADLWDSQATTIDAARTAAWAEPAEEEATASHLRRLDAVPMEGHLLDLGCGWGRLAIPMARSRPRSTVWAVDVSGRMLDHLRTESAGVTNLHPMHGDGVSLPPSLPMLAGAWSMLTFQHIPVDQLETYLRAIGRRLRPGGVFVAQLVWQTEPGPLSHPAEPSDLLPVCAQEGMTVEWGADRDYPTWWWLSARKTEPT